MRAFKPFSSCSVDVVGSHVKTDVQLGFFAVAAKPALGIDVLL